MARRQFTDEFKREAVRLASQPGISKASIASDLCINLNMLSRWAREQSGRVIKATEQGEAISAEEYERMRRELAKIRTERDILKKRSGTSLPTRSEVRLYSASSQCMASPDDVPGFGRIGERVL